MSCVIKDGEVYRVIYAAKMRDGDYRCVEAVDYEDCRRYLGRAAVSIKKRLLTIGDFHLMLFGGWDARRQVYYCSRVSVSNDAIFMEGAAAN